jgi:CubicO group peptidase (beta-lactamase class C family)
MVAKVMIKRIHSLPRRLHLIAVALLLAGLSACASTGSSAASAHFYPGATWVNLANPEALGWSSRGLDSVRTRLGTMPTTGFMAVVGGRVLLSHGDVDTLTYLASVRKSILSMLYGNYVASGKVNLDRTLADIGIDDHGGLTPAERTATTRHLLSARSGVYHPASNSGDDLEFAPPRGSQPPGTYYLYSNWDFNAVGTIFERETGRNIFDALESDLALPLGFQDWNRAIHRKGGDSTRSQHPSYHMHLSVRDMARIGYLMLREGNWSGRQVVPREWVRESTRAITPVSEMNPAARRTGPFGYGYLWWVWDGPAARGAYRGAYAGLGAVGQHIVVLPELDLVVAHKTAQGQGRSVSHTQFLEVLDQLVRARSFSAIPR